MQCRGLGPHLAPRGISHGLSLVAAGTWVISSSFDRDGTSKLVFVQQRQDSSLVARDTSGFWARFGRQKQKPLKVMWETQGPIQVVTRILGFLSIFKWSQASSPFEGLNSMCLSRCQRVVRPPALMCGDLGLSLGNPQGIQTSFHLVR